MRPIQRRSGQFIEAGDGDVDICRSVRRTGFRGWVSSRDLLGPSIIFGVALAVRLIYWWSVSEQPLLNHLPASPDSQFFDEWARAMVASGDWQRDQAFCMGPLYAYFLGAIYALVGPGVIAVRMVQVVIGALTAALLFGLTRRLFGNAAAHVAGGIATFYVPFLFFTMLLLPTTLVLFLITLGLYGLTVSLKHNRLPLLAWAGAAFGLAALGRPNLLLFIAAVPILMVSTKGLRSRCRSITAFLIPAAAVVGLATLHNVRAEGDLVVVSSHAGVNFYIGNSEPAQGIFYSPVPGANGPQQLNEMASRETAELAVGAVLTPSQASNWWFRRAWSFLNEKPRRALALYAKKLRLLTNNHEVALNFDYDFLRGDSFLHRLPVAWFTVILVLGSLGMALSVDYLDRRRAVLLLFPALYGASVLAFFVTARYRLPLALPLMVFGGYGTAQLWYLLRSRKWARLAPCACAGLVLTALSVWPMNWLPLSSATAGMHYRLAKLYHERGDEERAQASLEQAIQINPTRFSALRAMARSWRTNESGDRAPEPRPSSPVVLERSSDP